MNMNEKEIIELVHSTKSIIYNKEMAHEVTVKGAADYVTKVDVAVQKYLRKELWPGHLTSFSLQKSRKIITWIWQNLTGFSIPLTVPPT